LLCGGHYLLLRFGRARAGYDERAFVIAGKVEGKKV
jgi:hypothetical protein